VSEHVTVLQQYLQELELRARTATRGYSRADVIKAANRASTANKTGVRLTDATVSDWIARGRAAADFVPLWSFCEQLLLIVGDDARRQRPASDPWWIRERARCQGLWEAARATPAKPPGPRQEESEAASPPNASAPVTGYLFVGAAERLEDVSVDAALLERDLNLAQFTGRQWLIEQIDSFIAENSHGYVIIQAEAGMGKTALAAHLVWTRGWVHHFTQLGGRSPQSARKNLAAQLIERWNLGKRWAPGGAIPALCQPEWFSQLLNAAATERARRKIREPIVLVVDGLDEAAKEPGAVGDWLPLGLPCSLPDGVFMIVTSRFGTDEDLYPVRRPHAWLQIDVDDQGNLSDLDQFMAAVTDPADGDEKLIQAVLASGCGLERFHDAAVQACAGVWIYLRYVLDEIRNGTRNPRSLTELPSDLAGYYAEQIKRWRGARSDESAKREWKHVRLPLLGVLGAAQAPLSLRELALFANVPAEDVRAFTEETIRAFLDRRADQTGQVRYMLRHQSLRDLIDGSSTGDRPNVEGLVSVLAAQVQAAHRAIVDTLTPPGVPGERDWHEVGPYTRHHLAGHAVAAGIIDALVCDPGFLLSASTGSILSQRGSLHSPEATRAFAAFELSLHEWDPAAKFQTLIRLGANAARLHADALAAACGRYSDGEWQTCWASWGGRQHRKLASGTDVVSSVAIALLADNRQVIVSGSFDGTVRIWDAITGDPAGALAHDVAVTSVAIGRVGENDVIVTGTEDGTVRTWDALTCAPIGMPLAAHRESVKGLAVGRIGDQDIIVTGSEDKTARIWNAATREPVGVPLTGHRGAVRSLAVGRIGDQDIIVTGSEDKTARIWNATTGQQVGIALTHSDSLNAVVISRVAGRDVIITNAYDFRKISSPAAGSTVRIWDAITGQPRDTLLDYRRVVMSVAAGRIGENDVIVTGSFDWTVRMWDANSGAQIGGSLVGHTSSVSAVTLGRVKNRDVIVSGSGEQASGATVRIWEVPADDPAGTSKSGHRMPIKAVAFGRAGDRDVVVSGARDGTVLIWDAATGAQIATTLPSHSASVNAVAIGRSADGDVIITGADDGTVGIWDAATGNFIDALDRHRNAVCAVAIGKIGDRDIFVTATEFDAVRVWDALTHEQVHELVPGNRGAFSMAIGRAGNREIIVCGSLDGQIYIWDAATGTPTMPPLPAYSRARPSGHAGDVRCVAIGRSGARDVIVSGTWEKTVRIWDAVTGRPLGTPLSGHTDGVWDVAIGNVGNRDLVISASRDNTVRIWDAATGVPIGAPLTGHDGWVHSVAIGRTGGRDLIVSGSQDTTLIAYEYIPHGKSSSRPASG